MVNQNSEDVLSFFSNPKIKSILCDPDTSKLETWLASRRANSSSVPVWKSMGEAHMPYIARDPIFGHPDNYQTIHSDDKDPKKLRETVLAIIHESRELRSRPDPTPLTEDTSWGNVVRAYEECVDNESYQF